MQVVNSLQMNPLPTFLAVEIPALAARGAAPGAQPEDSGDDACGEESECED